MELNTTKQNIEIETVVGDESVQTPLRAESMVPGAGREAVEVLLEDATMALGAVEVQTDRVVLDGTVYCQAVYRQGEDPAARALAAQKAFNLVVDMPGATSKMICRAKGGIDHVEARYENGHIVFDVVPSLRVQVSTLEPVELISSVGGIDGLETQYQEVCSVKLRAESGAQALLREEVALPPELDARIALMDWHSVKVSGTTPEIGGVRVAGEVQTETLIGTGVPGRPAALVKVSMPFDQLVELPEWLTTDVASEVLVRKLSSSLQADAISEETKLMLEAELDVNVRASGQDSAVALTDAYATGDMAITTQNMSLPLCCGGVQVASTEAFKGTMLLPEDASAAGTVLATRVRPSLASWTAANGSTTFDGVLEAGVLYLPVGSDQLSSVRAEIPFTMRVAEELAEDAWVEIDATGAEAASLMNDRMELKCALSVTGASSRKERMQVLGSVEMIEAPARKGGMVLVWPTKEDTLWSIGKKYRLPASEISRMNGGADQVQAGKAVLLRM